MRHQRNRLVAFLAVPCLAAALQAQEAAKPSQEAPKPAPGAVIQVPAHESRWDYPKEVAPGPGQQVYFVQKGDTLWDLGKKFLGNPFAWPQIWELNKWIQDPHWIHPGDPLLVNGEMKAMGAPKAPGATDAAEEVADLAPDLRREGPRARIDELGYSFQDFIQLPFMVESAERFYREGGALPIINRQDATRHFLADGDRVYVEGGTDRGVKVGDRLVVVKLRQPGVFHPLDPHRYRPMGDVMQYAGVVRIFQVQAKASVAVIERSLDGIEVGDHIMPYKEPANMVLKLRQEADPVNVQANPARVVYLRESRSSAGGGDMAIIDQGSRQGLKVGDMLFALRDRELSTLPDSQGNIRHLGSTNYLLAQLLVVDVREGTATCRIVRSREEIFVGDLVTR